VPTICVQFDAPNPGSYTAWVDAYYGYSNEYIATVYVNATYDPPRGWVNPKFMVLGVLYAPPGNRSSVSYSNNTVVGSSTSVADSFANATNMTITMTNDIKILGFTASATTTASTSYTQENENSSSVSVSQTTTRTSTLAGFTDPATGLNHNYDLIVVWLNPILKFSAGTTRIHWEGYGYDMNDPVYPADMDIVHVPVGCLNGAFQPPHAMSPTCDALINGPLQRTWAQPNEDGSSPGLTGVVPCVIGSGTDLCSLLESDPFGVPGFAITPPSPGSYTTSDGRFTACHNAQCHSTFNFQPYFTDSYSQSYSTTNTESQTSTRTFSVGFSVDRGLKFTAFHYKFQGNLKIADTLTWRHRFNRQTSQGNTSAAQFSLVGPEPGYSGPSQFIIYQDNLYGTFVFNAQ
jgi:hypothetical protein